MTKPNGSEVSKKALIPESAASEANSEVDSSALEYNLSLSTEDRIRNHERARKLMLELKKAGEAVYANGKT